jgi:hypothetical protein
MIREGSHTRKFLKSDLAGDSDWSHEKDPAPPGREEPSKTILGELKRRTQASPNL